MDCEECGQCCMDVDAILLLPSEYQQLHTIDPIIESKTKKIAGIYYIVPNEQNICPYFDLASKKCSIYQHRPKVCRAYPFSYRRPVCSSSIADTFSEISPRSLYLTLCERFWTITQVDYKAGIKAIYQLRKEKFNLGILSQENTPTQKEIQIKTFEKTLEGEREEKKFPFDLYLHMVKQNRALFILFLKLFDAYFDDPKNQQEEYDIFIEKFITKFWSEPQLLQNAFAKLQKLWKTHKTEPFEFSFTIDKE
ncbi:MAG: hypothetical protein BAJALOKI1v1_1410001 [Promethearchaeota archaeon]|nr:MAG: hypothetical protein BAJALOKI1v1_1410001 [Candidatus Lokiarchaeota archaeon]